MIIFEFLFVNRSKSVNELIIANRCVAVPTEPIGTGSNLNPRRLATQRFDRAFCTTLVTQLRAQGFQIPQFDRLVVARRGQHGCIRGKSQGQQDVVVPRYLCQARAFIHIPQNDRAVPAA